MGNGVAHGLLDKRARPFFSVASGIQRSQPGIAILENVIGLKPCLAKVLARLRRCGTYKVRCLSFARKLATTLYWSSRYAATPGR